MYGTVEGDNEHTLSKTERAFFMWTGSHGKHANKKINKTRKKMMKKKRERKRRRVHELTRKLTRIVVELDIWLGSQSAPWQTQAYFPVR